MLVRGGERRDSAWYSVVDDDWPAVKAVLERRLEGARAGGSRAVSTVPAEGVSPSWPLETERLTLRPYTREDLDALFAMHSDEEVVRYLYNEARTLDEVRDLLEHKIAGSALRAEGEWLSAAVVLRESGELVADFGLLWASERYRQGEIGYIVHPHHQGKGYATEAARPLLAFGFETLGLHRIAGRAEARNIGSARVLEKLGMRREAHLVENEWVKDEWQSELVYALLATEWAALGGGPTRP
jgi:RimJ/RimL family protein N-acetyltransferase